MTVILKLFDRSSALTEHLRHRVRIVRSKSAYTEHRKVKHAEKHEELPSHQKSIKINQINQSSQNQYPYINNFRQTAFNYRTQKKTFLESIKSTNQVKINVPTSTTSDKLHSITEHKKKTFTESIKSTNQVKINIPTSTTSDKLHSITEHKKKTFLESIKSTNQVKINIPTSTTSDKLHSITEHKKDISRINQINQSSQNQYPYINNLRQTAFNYRTQERHF